MLQMMASFRTSLKHKTHPCSRQKCTNNTLTWRKATSMRRGTSIIVPILEFLKVVKFLKTTMIPNHRKVKASEVIHSTTKRSMEKSSTVTWRTCSKTPWTKSKMHLLASTSNTNHNRNLKKIIKSILQKSSKMTIIRINRLPWILTPTSHWNETSCLG